MWGSDALQREIGFWVSHCFASILPLFVFIITMGSDGKKKFDVLLAMSFGTLLFAGGCTLVASRFGGFSKSNALFPRSLRCVLKARAVMVAIMGVSYLIVKVTGTEWPMIVVIPDVIVTFQAGSIYGSLKETASVGGNRDVNLARSFLNYFVGVQFVALTWAVVFSTFALLVMIPLRIKDEKAKLRRCGNGFVLNFPSPDMRKGMIRIRAVLVGRDG